MTDPQDPQAGWMDAWLVAQREAWQRLFAAPGVAEPPPPGPQQFYEMFGGRLPESSADVMRKLMDFGEGYLGVAREFWRAIDGADAAGPHDAANLRSRLEQLRGTFTQAFSRLYGGAPAGGDLLGAWQKLGGAMFGPAGAPGFEQALAMPALGLARERQEATQRLGRAGLRYQKAMQRFSDLLGLVAGDALDRLSKSVLARAERRQPLDSLRAVFDLWIESGEQAYAAAAHGAEFAAAQAELNDALVELRSEQQRLAADWARAFDLPTRSEVNTLLKRLNTVRRRLRELEEEVEQLRSRR
jgi:uncharacterized protein YukE